LSVALERVNILARTGKIDRSGLRALRSEIERAKRAGMLAQHLVRLASGDIRQANEEVHLTQMFRDVLLERGREISSKGIELHQSMRPADVLADPTLLHTLFEATIDWLIDQAPTSIEVRIDRRPWPPVAFLNCRVVLPTAADGTHINGQLDNLSWRLVQQIAWSLQLGIERVGQDDHVMLTFDFPQTIDDNPDTVGGEEIDAGFGVSLNSKPLAGSHILVLASKRDLRSDIRESVRHMGLLVDFVASVEEAEAFVQEARPHAIVYESALSSDRFDRLRQTLLNRVPDFVFIEVAEEGSHFELSADSGRRQALMGRDAVLQSLPTALVFELSRNQ
jgi:hypothetical protein